MANKNDSEKSIKKNIKDASALDKVAAKLLDFSDSTFAAVGNIQQRGNQFQEVINRQLEISKGVSGGSILDFAQGVRNENDRKYLANHNGGSRSTVDLTQQLQASAGNLYTYFQDMYQNKYLEMSDLRFISKFIPALGEAVKVTLDAVASSDNLSSTMTRQIVFDASVPIADQQSVTKTIEDYEKSLKIQKKLKNVVYKTTLVSGKFYVYAVSYRKLFERYNADRESLAVSASGGPIGLRGRSIKATESAVTDEFAPLMESYCGIETIKQKTRLDKDLIDHILAEESTGVQTSEDKAAYKNFVGELQKHVSNVRFVNTPIPEFILEDLPVLEAAHGINDSDYKGVFDRAFGETPIKMDKGSGGYADGAVDIASGAGAGDKFDVDGTYIQYIDPKYIVPGKIMNSIFGYYYITAKKKDAKTGGVSYNSASSNSMLNGANGIFNSVSLSDSRKTQLQDSIIGSITQEIIDNFDKKFVSKNANFKKVIADCITYHGYMDNEFHVQFIPADDIIEFTINEDTDGNGESILADSLFPAKLLLSLTVSKMLNYLNNSSDRTLVHVAKGPIDTHTNNQIQRVIRNMQETNITFSDLLSTNLVFNKFGRGQKMIMPTAKNGTKLVEFETLEGMTMDMNSDYEKHLEDMAIMGTGVPSVIMEYVNQADFAKGFETGNLKFASRISSYQSDLEDPTTDFYARIVENSSIDDQIKSKVRNKFMVKLPRPKVLSNSNNSEYLGTVQGLMQTVTGIMMGEDTSDPSMVKVREEFQRLAMRKYAPYIDWDDFDSMKKEALKAQTPEKDALAKPDDSGI